MCSISGVFMFAVFLLTDVKPPPVHVDLPVGLPADVDVVEVAAVVFGVCSSQQQLPAGLRVRVPEATNHSFISSALSPAARLSPRYGFRGRAVISHHVSIKCVGGLSS